MRRYLTDDQRTAILRAYLSGTPDKEIAARWGVNPNYPRVLAQRAGQSRALIRRRPQFERQVEKLQPIVGASGLEIRRLHDRGLGVTAIAALLRVPYRAVTAVLDG